MKPVAFHYHRARDIDDALAQLADPDAKVMAGGCSLGPMLNLRLVRPSLLVDLRHVEELRQVSDAGDHLVVGALRTHAEFEDRIVPDVTNGFLPHVAHGIAYRAVRNRGTMGGSLVHADPAADWVSTLMALDARLILKGPKGVRQLSVDRFMIAGFTTDLADDEILTAIQIRKLSSSALWAYRKNCRKTGEFAKAIAAVVFDPKQDHARVVCGATEATPAILAETSEALRRGGKAAALSTVEDEVRNLLADHTAVFQSLHLAALRRSLDDLECK